ncbi:MAG: DegV family protein [Clostridia bacterium]|nr:DegV family protein [Clostridia bacterium]
MSYVIVTDSCANLPETIIDQYDISIVPLSFHVGDRELKSYEKGKVTDFKQFYDMMRNKEVITTSLVSPEKFIDFFKPLLEAGQDVLYLGFSSGLSGTYQSATIAADDLKGLYPQRQVITVDSLCACGGQGLMVLYAAQMREQGSTIDEVATWLKENILRMAHWFTCDDLFFLKRGGRISGATAVVGSLLQVKPVLHVNDEGKLVSVSKARGRKQALAALVAQMEKTVEEPQKQTLFIAHADCEEDALYIKKLVENKFSVKDIIVHYIDPVIGAHAGPGTVALFFLGANRY